MEMNVMTGTYFLGDDAYSFNFYTDLSVANKLKFVNSVVDILVDDGHYNSVLRNIMFDFFVIDVFTDIDTTELKDSNEFLNDVEQFLNETNIVEIIMANASPAIFIELNTAVDKSVEYLTGIHTNPVNDAFANLLSTIERKINEVDLDSMMAMAKKFAEMTDGFNMDSFVNSYMNSDFHKKNMMEIEEAKKQREEFASDMDKAIKLVNKTNKK
jgi:hypothetical protein